MYSVSNVTPKKFTDNSSHVPQITPIPQYLTQADGSQK